MHFYQKNLFVLFSVLLCGVLASQDRKIVLYKGNDYFKKEAYDKASSYYKDAIEKKENDFDGHYNLANTLYKQGKYQQAETEYQKAFVYALSNEDKKMALYNNANAKIKQKKYAEAKDLYKASLKHSPFDSLALRNYQIAQSLLQKEQQEKQNKNSQRGDTSNKNQPDQSEKEQKENPNEKKNQASFSASQQKDLENQKQEQKQQLSQQQIKELEEQIQQKEKETTHRVFQNKIRREDPSSNRKDW